MWQRHGRWGHQPEGSLGLCPRFAVQKPDLAAPPRLTCSNVTVGFDHLTRIAGILWLKRRKYFCNVFQTKSGLKMCDVDPDLDLEVLNERFTDRWNLSQADAEEEPNLPPLHTTVQTTADQPRSSVCCFYQSPEQPGFTVPTVRCPSKLGFPILRLQTLSAIILQFVQLGQVGWFSNPLDAPKTNPSDTTTGLPSSPPGGNSTQDANLTAVHT